jgi:hypothetical protein
MTLNVTPYSPVGCYESTVTPNCLFASHSHDACCITFFQMLTKDIPDFTESRQTKHVSLYRATAMVHVTFWLQLLPLLLTLRQSDADGDRLDESKDEISSFKQNTLKRLAELEHRNEILVSQYYMNCCYCTAIYSLMLFACLCLFVVARVELHRTSLCMSVYDLFRCCH